MSSKTPTSPFHKKFESLNLKYAYPNVNSTVIRFSVQDISGSEHAGTHMDAPMHFKTGGQTMEEIPIELFTGPAIVINIEERARQDVSSEVEPEDLEKWEGKHGQIPENAFVLMNSGWDKFAGDEKKYFGNDRRDPTDLHFPGFSGEACQWLIENRVINGLGVDTSSIDSGESVMYPCHNVLSENNILILENIFNIGELPPKGATLRAYPMKIKGGTGAPTRIIASINKAHIATHAENALNSLIDLFKFLNVV